VEFVPVAITSVLVAIAGPVGIALGWWLGRRGERDRQRRQERKDAYIAFVHGAIRFRNASDEERQEIREERWAALAEIVLIAPPALVEAASYQVVTGDRLLDPSLSAEDRRAVWVLLWERNRMFTRLARADLGLGLDDPWDGMRPIIGERLDFEIPPDG
jgi:hypothetical protein